MKALALWALCSGLACRRATHEKAGSVGGEIDAGDSATSREAGAVVVERGDPSSPVRQLASGGDTTCALKADGSVWCWGSNRHRQLGIPETTLQSGTPIEVRGVRATQIAVASGHVCARTAARTLLCWGANGSRQLGHVGGTASCDEEPCDEVPRPTPIVDASEVVLGDGLTCALRGDSTVWCVGAAGARELPEWKGVAQLAFYGPSRYARLPSGKVLVEGYNRGLGPGSTDHELRVPTPVPGFDDITELAAGEVFACGRRKDGALVCWGAPGVEDGFEPVGSWPLPITGLGNVTQVTAGPYHACVVVSDGKVLCWGQGGWVGEADGRLGYEPLQRCPHYMNSTIQKNALLCSLAPLPVPGLEGALQASAGNRHTCARLADGTVRCWGDNTRGQLGDGSASKRTTVASVRFSSSL